MKGLIKKIYQNRIVQHVTFWLLFILFQSTPYLTLEGKWLQALLEITMVSPSQMLMVYVVIYLLIPRYLFMRKYMKFLLSVLGTLVISMLFYRSIQIFINGPLFYPEKEHDWIFFNPLYLIYGLFPLFIITGFAATIKLVKRAFNNIRQTQQLSNEKLEAELKLLKSQIHPHFLFNTLNNLYALALDNSQKTAKGILRLSDLLHYILYDCNASLVSLDKEVKLIKDYISLETLRYSDRLQVDLNVIGESRNKLVPPMIILPFVENAFKHGTSKHLQKALITINLTVEEKRLILLVENSKPSGKLNEGNGYAEGIGLKNVKRRLDLLYGSSYSMLIDDQENTFSINLEVEFIHPLTNMKHENQMPSGR